MNRVVRFFLVPILLFTTALFGARLFSYLKYAESFAAFDRSAIARSFLLGLRFDLSTAALFSAPFFALLFLPVLARNRIFTKVVRVALLLWYLALLMYEFIDVEYYAFVHRHLTFEAEDMWRDTGSIFQIGFSRYLPEVLGLFALLTVFACVFLWLVRIPCDSSSRTRPERRLWPSLAEGTGILALVVAASVVLARGGIAGKPLDVRSAFANESVELGVLSLNGLYTTLQTLYEKRANEPSAFVKSFRRSSPEADALVQSLFRDDRTEAPPGYPLYKGFKRAESERRPLNVVLFFMESWSAKYVGALGAERDATPFFDELSKEGMLLTNCLANGQRSRPGLSATAGSIPVWKGMVLAEGDGLLYQTRLELPCSVLKRYGYDTIFIQGSSPGTMRLDRLVKRLGFEKQITSEDFSAEEKNDDGVWGIYDKNAFLKAHKLFLEEKKPFFAVVYSLTSHTPYRLPSRQFDFYDPSVPYRDFLNTLRYSDYALKSFFDVARNAPYFRDTLFVIVGDHTEGPSTNANYFEGHRIPCLFFCPGIVQPGLYPELASQVDIVPTLFDVLRVSAPFTSWGKSIFASGPRRALLSRGDLFLWAAEPYLLLTDLRAPLGLYDYQKDPARNLLEPQNEGAKATSARLLDEARHYLKFSFDVIRENKVCPPEQDEEGARR